MKNAMEYKGYYGTAQYPVHTKLTHKSPPCDIIFYGADCEQCRAGLPIHKITGKE